MTVSTKRHRGRPPIPDTKRSAIIEALTHNPNTSQVAREIGGVRQSTVWKIAKEAGIELTAGKAARGQNSIPDTKRSAIIEALTHNPNTSQVAREIGGVRQSTVWKIAKEAGIELTAGKAARGQNSIPDTKRSAIIEALTHNPNTSQVAREIGGVRQSTVWKIAKEAGIELTAGKAARGQNSIPDTKRSAIIEALTHNPNTSQVAREIGGVRQSTVWKIAKEAGIRLAGKGRPRRKSETPILSNKDLKAH